MGAATVIAIPNEEDEFGPKGKRPAGPSLLSRLVSFVKEKGAAECDNRRLIHGAKVGIALVLVSLLYIMDPLYDQVGENAVWAIMTVVVVFEFYAGAVLSKGINRAIGTLVGGGFGYLVAVSAQSIGKPGNGIAVGASIFVSGAAATYSRLLPKIKKKYDYGVMIFILTFNLVAVTGIRAENVLQIARERLSTIGMGFAICIFVSLLVFPIWAGDELHKSMASNFLKLASSIEGLLEEYFKQTRSEKERRSSAFLNNCKLILDSKSKNESLANFARWEPWHGKFGFSYPWDKYLQIGETLRELAALILSLKGCGKSCKEISSTSKQAIEEHCEDIGSSLSWALREFGGSIMNMKTSNRTALVMPKLQLMRSDLKSFLVLPPGASESSVKGLDVAGFMFLLVEMVDKVEKLEKDVEELSELAGFHAK